MLAAVLTEFGKSPNYQMFTEPSPKKENEVLLTMKAVALKNIDKLRASGTHYASYTSLPAVVGLDGVGTLPNGKRVYAQGITGTFAQKALVSATQCTEVPAELSDSLAAALPNAVLGAAMALKFRAKMQVGQTVLINGATGVTGQLAFQIAKLAGAKTIIVTGRNEATLEKLVQLGADHCISLHLNDEIFVKTIQAIHQQTPIDIVIDYLWGNPLTQILNAFKTSGIHAYSHPVKVVTVGNMAVESITLNSGLLRSSAIELMGSGLGSLSEKEMDLFYQDVLPEMYQHAVNNRLSLPIRERNIKEITSSWLEETNSGERLVFLINHE